MEWTHKQTQREFEQTHTREEFMKIIGRNREKDVLSSCLSSNRPEFVVVYGRRRVGTIFFIKEFFNGQFSFYATGL